ncbi:MAG: HEAT repeat domain-containing protein [Planctomycetota bacterium]
MRCWNHLPRHLGGFGLLVAVFMASAVEIMAHRGIPPPRREVPPPPGTEPISPDPPPPPPPPEEKRGDPPPPASTPGVGVPMPGHTGGATPSTAVTPRGRGARGATTGISKRRSAAEVTGSWQAWWSYNQEPYLELRRRLEGGGVVSGSAGFLLGPERDGAVRLVRPDALDVQERILPALLGAVAQDDVKVVESALLALGRVVPAEQAGQVLRCLVMSLGHGQASVKECALLALGILGSAEARPILVAVLKDTPRGQSALRVTGSIATHLRAVAAIALGLIGVEDDIPCLMAIVERAGASSGELEECALLALGLFPTGEEQTIPFLVRMLGRADLDRSIRALVPIALAKMENPVAKIVGRGALLRLLRDDSTDNNLRRSCLLALAKMTPQVDPDVVGTVVGVIDNDSDGQSRFFALVALGEIGARDAAGFEERRQEHGQLLRVLMSETTRPKRRDHRPWAALGLAIYGRELCVTYPRETFQMGERLTECYVEEGDPSVKAALAIALGLLRHREAEPYLVRELRDTNDYSVAGHHAVALGLLQSEEAADLMRAWIQEKGTDPVFRVALARGLALLGDTRSVDILVQALVESRTLYETATLAQAIGILGHRSAMDPLIAILADPARPEACRDYTAAALGLLAEKTPLRWTARVTVGLNYCIPNTTLALIAELL